MVEVGTGGSKTRFIKTDWPIEEGLEAGTTKQEGRQTNLVPERGSKVLKRDKEGLD